LFWAIYNLLKVDQLS